MSLPINAPSEPGLYWARERKIDWWNLIVRVTGDAPYLKMDFIWRRNDDTSAKPYDVFAFGSKIEEPSVPILESKEK